MNTVFLTNVDVLPSLYAPTCELLVSCLFMVFQYLAHFYWYWQLIITITYSQLAYWRLTHTLHSTMHLACHIVCACDNHGQGEGTLLFKWSWHKDAVAWFNRCLTGQFLMARIGMDNWKWIYTDNAVKYSIRLTYLFMYGNQNHLC